MMIVSRLVGASRPLALAALTMVLGLAASIAAPAAARADAVPFWEQADLDAKKAKARKSAYAPNKKSKRYAASGSSKKKYATKSAGKKLGGYAALTEPKKKKYKGVKVAALGNSYYPQAAAPAKSLSGGGVRWVASSGCLDGSLKAVVYQVAASFGPVTVNSTCRSKGRNRAVGGAPRSKHLSGDAVDFRVRGNIGAVYAYLKSSGSVGGLKHYGGGLFHIDNGDRRSW